MNSLSSTTYSKGLPGARHQGYTDDRQSEAGGIIFFGDIVIHILNMLSLKILWTELWQNPGQNIFGFGVPGDKFHQDI